ncbi:Cytochrome P450 [Phaeobacter piscinae]|uniref:Cytochrome P450 n=1 Tax=Phaeobacter piscinae TaxID=1580596 RepID=A0ABM6PCI2_9RHOB|nr:cytochrome P450 [Phaeobacter piscinae]ATG35445.1 Cytochrome P450 [Phaeobacter piscinae]AUQ85965.1 Cytochrome P450 [Phaeobacter piscinae]AUR23849.1 Cytochrome P450 [Phaeobacter piscinae]
MTQQEIPIFDANSTMFQNIGLLKVAETATRQHGDIVAIRVSDTRDLYIAGNPECFHYWRSHQGHFQTDLGDIASNQAITRMLLGDELQDPRWSDIWVLTANRMSAIARDFDGWLETALAEATKTLIRDLPQDGTAVDLRDLCRDWSIRAVCPAIFGADIDVAEIAQGVADVEGFYFAMSTQDAAETADHEKMPEFQAARGFLDKAISAALNGSTGSDSNLIAQIATAIPPDVSAADRLNLLRPTVGHVITEKLNIGGLSLLWTLVQLAQDPKLVADIRTECLGKDPLKMSDSDSPLASSTVKEGLRLFPELPFIYRITSEAVTMGDYVIPSGATVVFAPWLIQRDPRFWEAPKRFQGDRFLEQTKHDAHYFPFGVGARIRSRGNFMLHQLTLAARTICSSQTFALSPECPRGNIRPLLRSALIPRGAVPVVFNPRTSSAEPVDDHALADAPQ